MNDFSAWIIPGVSVIFGAGVSWGVLTQWRKEADKKSKQICNEISKIQADIGLRPKPTDVMSFGRHTEICRGISDRLKDYFDEKFMMRDAKLEVLLISITEVKTSLIDIKAMYLAKKIESVR